MEKRSFNIIVLSVAGLSIIFQGIGLFAPAWLRCEMSGAGALGGVFGAGGNNNPFSGLGSDSTDDFGDALESVFSNMLNIQAKMTVYMGLWFGCVSTSVKASTVSKSQTDCASNFRAGAGLGDIADLTPELVLCILAAISTIGGLILLIFLLKVEVKLALKALLCITAWGLTAVLLFIAIGVRAGRQSGNLKKIGIDSSAAQLPWALVMCGIAAFLAAVVGVLVLLSWRKQSDNSGSPGVGVWNRFTNAVV